MSEVQIYLIRNTVTSKSYVGVTSQTLKRRFNGHASYARTRRGKSYLYKSIRKYGISCFTIELLEAVNNQDIAYEREKFWIATLNTIAPNGYNAHEGGRGGLLNPTNEVREKLSKAKIGHTPHNKGKRNPHAKRNIKRKSPSVAQKERWKLPPESIYKFTKADGTVILRNSMYALCKEFGYKPANFTRLKQGKLKSYKGFVSVELITESPVA